MPKKRSAKQHTTKQRAAAKGTANSIAKQGAAPQGVVDPRVASRLAAKRDVIVHAETPELAVYHATKSAFARHGYVPAVLIALASFAMGMSEGTWRISDAAVVTETDTVASIAFAERWALSVETPRTMRLASVDPAARLQHDSEPIASREPKSDTKVAALHPVASAPAYFEPSSKGYIMYANSPTHWTAVPLPDEIGAARAEHNKNIRAEIEQAAMLFDLDIVMMKAFARIESGFRPWVTTGRYKCLFQLSDWEFRKYWQGDIYDIRNCSIAAARKLATEAAQFEHDVGRKVTAIELYMIHQQGFQGAAFHYNAPHQLAWKNMFLTNEGQEKGEAWARKSDLGQRPVRYQVQVQS